MSGCLLVRRMDIEYIDLSRWCGQAEAVRAEGFANQGVTCWLFQLMDKCVDQYSGPNARPRSYPKLSGMRKSAGHLIRAGYGSYEFFRLLARR